MKFQGTVLPIDVLLSRSLQTDVEMAESGVPSSPLTIRHTARRNARRCAQLLRAGEALESAWRFGILQTFDDYRSTVARGGVLLGAGVFTEEPDATGSPEVDAAFAALAEYLAQRDGWTAPSWCERADRLANVWYPDVPEIFRQEAEAFSPPAFRGRGIYITERSLARV